MKVVLVCAVTIDGKIARHSQERVTWNSEGDKRFFAKEVKRHPVVIMGRKTYEAHREVLRGGRLYVVLSRRAHMQNSRKGHIEWYSGSARELVSSLSGRGFSSAMVAGGSEVNRLFLAEGCVDELYITVEPRIFGEGIPLAAGFGVDMPLRFVSGTPLAGGSMLLHFIVPKEK